MRLFTIGFTRKTARRFFGLLQDAKVRRILDVRLNNVSQLSGFAKREDLAFFAEAIGGMDYVHLPQLAPTQIMLDDWRKGHKHWPTYERQFLALLAERRVETTLSQEQLAEGCLLCSEAEPHHCHRRLVAEYLARHWGDVAIGHL